MLNWLKKQLAAPVFEGEMEKTRVAALLNKVLWSALLILVVAGPFFVAVNETASDRQLTLVLVGGFALALLALVHLLRQGAVRTASTLFCSLLWLFVFATTLVFGGIRSSIVPAYLLAIFISGFLLGERGAIVFGGLSITAIFGVFIAEYYFDAVLRLPRPNVALDNAFLLSAIFAWMTVMVVLGWRNRSRTLERARRDEQALRERIEDLRESRAAVEARTRELEQRTLQLRTAAEVARDVTVVSELDTLLSRIVNLIAERFGFYHVALFLIDDTGEYAVLQTAAGHASEEIMAQEMRLRVGYEGLVGRAVSTSEAQVIQDVHESPLYLANPLLAETHSEVVMPLRVGSDIIGALDVHRRELNAFPDAEIAVLQILVDQMAVAISNTRLITEAQATVQELMATSGQYTREAWRETAEGERTRGYHYDRSGVVSSNKGNSGSDSVPGQLAIPLKLREQVIGAMSLQFESDDVPAETQELLESIAERLVLSLENARLLEASRKRAMRERLVSDIATDLRAATDVEGVLRRMIRELGQALDAQGVVRMDAGRHRDSDEAGKEVA